MRYLFISDLHLKAQRSGQTGVFLHCFEHRLPVTS